MDVGAGASATGKKARRTQQERSTEARSKLIAASIELIVRNGFAATTMADIAALAGLTRGAIQHHFEGRVDLVLAILQEVEDQISGSFQVVSPQPGVSLEQRVSALIDQLGAIARSEAYLAVIDIWIATRSDPALRDGAKRSLQRSWDYYRELWQRSFIADVPSDVIADCRRMVVVMLRGLAISRVLANEPRSLARTLDTCKIMVTRHMTSAQKPRKKPVSRR
jgi:AcrR family transcriptional regulator